MKINDVELLEIMRSLISHDDDVRPVWIGPELAETDNVDYQNFSRWANQHWGLYGGFLNNITDNSTILDLGCGCGFCTINLQNIFKNSLIHGVDIDIESINFGRKFNFNDNIEYKCEDIIKVKLPKSDYIFLIETLEHIKYDKQYLIIDKCLSSLKSNGLIFISTPKEEVNYDYLEKGHIGIMTNQIFNLFKERYKNNIVNIEYYDNQNLLSNNIEDYTNNINGSHYKIILKK